MEEDQYQSLLNYVAKKEYPSGYSKSQKYVVRGKATLWRENSYSTWTSEKIALYFQPLDDSRKRGGREGFYGVPFDGGRPQG